MRVMRIQVDPSFVEEGVFLTIQSLGMAENFHSEKNAIYENGKDEESFKKFFKKYFESLGLQAIFENCLSEFPLLNGSEILVFVRRVFSKKEEGSELYLEGGLKTAVISLQVLRLRDRMWLEVFLRREFLRVSDMLDPAFCYLPTLEIGGDSPVQDNRIRERFSRLWDDYIEQRLSEPRGAARPKTQEQLLELARAFFAAKPQTVS